MNRDSWPYPAALTTGSIRALAVGCLALGVLAGLGSVAYGESQPTITINLATGAGEHPKHVCIVSNAKARNGAYLHQLDGLIETTTQGRRNAWRFRAGHALRENAFGCDGPNPSPVCKHRESYPGVWDALALMSREHRRNSSGLTCGGSELGACEPTFQIAEVVSAEDSDFRDLNIVCAENTDVSASERVGVFLFRFPQAYPLAIEAVAFNTATVTVSLAEKFLKGEYVVVSVAGGSYVSWGYSEDAVDKVDVNLQPRCRLHELKLPPMAPIGAGELCVLAKLYDERAPNEPLTCMQGPVSARGIFNMFSPARAAQNTKILRGQSFTGDCDDPTAEQADALRNIEGTFQAFWSGARPPPVVTLEPRSLSFDWEVDCLYGEVKTPSDCPRATLPEMGVECTPHWVDPVGDDVPFCRYSCFDRRGDRSGRSSHLAGSGFELPAKVRFQRRGEATVGSVRGGSATHVVWEDELVYLNQRLRSYVKTDDRFVEIDFSGWLPPGGTNLEEVLRAPADRVSFVEVTTPDGRKHKVSPWGTNQRVAAPGVECSDFLAYTVTGQRKHGSAFVRLHHGKLQAPPLSLTAKTTRFWLGMRIGSVMAPAVDIGADELGEGSANLVFPPKPYGLIHADAAYHGLGWPVILEGQVIYLVNDKVFYPVWELGELPDRESNLYQRYLVGGNLVGIVRVPGLGEVFPLVGGGLGWGFPFFRSDQGTSGPPQMLGYAHIGLRKALQRWAQLEGGVRVTFGDDTQIFSTDFKSTPRNAVIAPIFVGIEGGLRFGL